MLSILTHNVKFLKIFMIKDNRKIMTTKKLIFKDRKVLIKYYNLQYKKI